MNFSNPLPRTYVECPRCHSTTAFITYERVETYCSFCPECRHLWNTLQPEFAGESAAAKSGAHVNTRDVNRTERLPTPRQLG